MEQAHQKIKLWQMNRFFPKTFKEGYFLVPIILLGAILRVIGINFGLPQVFHPDEPHIVLATKQFFEGDFNPHNFLYPSLLMYIIHIIQRIYYSLPGTEISLPSLYLISRLVVAFLGTLSILLVFYIAKKIHGRKTAFLSATIIALSIGHITDCHYATTDVPLTFFVLLCIWSILRLTNHPDFKHYLLVGVTYGLTVSTKIPGAVLLFTVILVHLYLAINEKKMSFSEYLKTELFSKKILIKLAISGLVGVGLFFILRIFDVIASQLLEIITVDIWVRYYDQIVQAAKIASFRLFFIGFLATFGLLFLWNLLKIHVRWLISLILVSIAVFFLTTPFAILDYEKFLHDFMFQMVVSQTTWSGKFAENGPALLYNAKIFLTTLDFVFTLTAGLGIIFYIVKPTIQRWILLSFVGVYYLYIASWKLMFGRYMIPILPLLAIISAFAVLKVIHFLTDKIKLIKSKLTQRILISALYVVMIVVPCARLFSASLNFDRYLLAKNTKTVAYEWVIENISPDSTVLREQYAPQIELAGYKVHNVRYAFNDSVDADFVLREQFDYIIVTDKMWKRPVQIDGQLYTRKAYSEITTYSDLIYKVKPDSVHPGPEIKIYKVNKDHIKHAKEKE